jgi:hypothetical protein
VKKLHNQHHPAGLEWRILKMLPMVMAAGVFVPLFLSVVVRLFPLIIPEADVSRLQIGIDILSISIFFTVLSGVITVAIGCITIVLMKGPAYIADAYELDDADRPDREEDNKTKK